MELSPHFQAAAAPICADASLGEGGAVAQPQHGEQLRRALGWRIGVELIARLIATNLTFHLIGRKRFAPRPPAAPIPLTFSV